MTQPNADIPPAIEAKIQEGGVRSTAWVRGRIFQSWRENPLLIREAGLREGTPIWRSAWTMIMIVTLVFSAASAALSLYSATNQGNPLPWWWNWRAQVWSGFIISCVPVWFCARAWARDSEPGMRDQIATTRLTLDQLIKAKATIWLYPLILYVVITSAVSFFILVLQLTASPGSTWDAGFRATEDMSTWYFFKLVAVGMALQLLSLLAGAVLKITLATRLTIWRFNAPVAFILAVSASWVLMNGVGRLYSWWFMSRVAAGPPPNVPMFIYYVIGYGPPIITIIVAIAVWWGIYRHVARVYGMER